MSASLSLEFLQANADALSLPPRARVAVMEATPRGEIAKLADGSPVISVDGVMLGAPPHSGAAQKAYAAVMGQKSLVVVFGLGTGQAARELRGRARGNVLVYEPDAGLLRTALENGPTDLGGIFITTDLRELEAIWPALTDDANALLFQSPGYAELFPTELEALKKSIQMMICDTEIIENTRSARFAQWVEHITCNLHVLQDHSPVTALAGSLTGVPAFIIGAGPSLDKNIEELKRAKKKGIVIAVDVAGGALDRKGIAPHMIVCLEALNLSSQITKLSYVKEVILAASLTAHPDCFTVPAGHMLPFFESLKTFSAIAELTNVPGVIVGGSVSTVAFSLAHVLGCSPVVLVGQDLAYEGTATHAKGTAFDGCTIQTQDGKVAAFAYNDTIKKVRAESSLGAAPARDPVFDVAAWGGGEKTVISTASFNAFRLWFEIWATAMAGKVDLVNATEGGSRIEGFREMSLTAVLDTLPDQCIDPAEIAANARAARPPLSTATLHRFFDDQVACVATVARHARELARAASNAEALIATENAPQIVRAFDVMSKAEENLRVASAAASLLQGYLYADTAKLRETTPDTNGRDMREDAIWSVATSKKLAYAIIRSAKNLTKILRRGKSAVTQSPKQTRRAAA